MFIRSPLVLVSALAVGLACAGDGRADLIELFDGTRIETTCVTVVDDAVVTADGRRIPRNDVRRILFGQTGAMTDHAEDATSGGDVERLLERAAAARERWSDVGAITLIDDAETTLRPDGTQLERTHSASLILKEPWKDMLGGIMQAYEEGRSRVRLVRARTISPDGTVHEFDPADLKETKPSGGMVFFNKYKTVSGQLPEVEIGSIVEVIWESETYNPYDENLFFPRWYFGSTEPVVSSRIRIRVPEGRSLYWETNNLGGDAAEPKRATEDGYDVYEWALEDVEHVVSEPAMPPVGQVVPGVAASLFEDWDYIFDYLGQFQREHTEVTPEIEDKVAEITAGAETAEQKLAKIYHWLQREIRYISIKGSMGSGWSGHPATLTLQNKYGDCIDKATLMAAMCKAAGISAWPVILMTNNMPADDRSLPTLYGNHAITKVELDGREFHLDCTGTSFRYPYFVLMDHGVSTINVLERRIGRTEVPPPEDNLLNVNLRMRLATNGTLKVILKLSGNGSVEGIARNGLEQINAMLRQMVAQQLLNQFSPGAELKDLEVTDESDLETPLEVTLKIVLPEYPTEAGDLMIFEMPLAKLANVLSMLTALESRDFDIQLPSTFCVRQHTELELPNGYVPRGLPDAALLRTPYTDYHASYAVDGDKVVFEDTLKITQRVVPDDNYATLKQFMNDVADYMSQPLFLSKTGS